MMKEKFLYRKSNGSEYKILSANNMHGEWWFDVLSSFTGLIHSYSKAELSDFISDFEIEQYKKELEEWKLSNEKEEVKFKYEVGQELQSRKSNLMAKITHRGSYVNSKVNYYQVTYEDDICIEIDENQIFKMFVLIGEEPSKQLKHSGEYVGEFKKSVTDEVELNFDRSAVSSSLNQHVIKLAEDVGEVGKYQELANEIGKFTDNKDKLYGSSVDATYGMMKVLLERYRYDDAQYLIPEELIQHILLQVRMMDKQNRIFQNPSGEGDSESPYRDLAGYSLIGIDMVEK